MSLSLVTGGNRGIGLEVARALAARGDRVVVVCRDVATAESATHDFASLPTILGCDLADLAAVRALAERLTREFPRIDRLVLNAGIWPTKRELVGELERAFVVNHLAPFLLLRRLEPVFEASGTRVVSVTAGLAERGAIDLAKTPSGLDFGPVHTYATTKLAHLALLPEYAARLGGLGASIVAVHPGVVRTGLGDRDGLLGFLLRRVKRGWLSPVDGAAPVVECALDPSSAESNGRYYLERATRELPAVAHDTAFRASLVAQAESLTGLGPR